jgi:hypothetical protein
MAGVMNCNCRKECGSSDEPKLKCLGSILYSCLDIYSERQINMTKLTVVSPPKHTQHSLHLRGTEDSDHLHASADLTLRAKLPSVSELVIQLH